MQEASFVDLLSLILFMVINVIGRGGKYIFEKHRMLSLQNKDGGAGIHFDFIAIIYSG